MCFLTVDTISLEVSRYVGNMNQKYYSNNGNN